MQMPWHCSSLLFQDGRAQESVSVTLDDFYLVKSEPLFVVCMCLGILYEGCEGYAPVAFQDEQGSKTAEVVASQDV